MTRADWVALAAAIILAVAAMGRTLTCDFVAWDDPQTIAHPDPPAPADLGRYWTTPQAGLYVPLTYTTWALVAAVTHTAAPGEWGAHLDPAPFHAANLLIHLGGVALVFHLTRRLVGGGPVPALAAAVVFGTHPLQVEPVAWASGTKDLLAAVLGLGAIACYLRAWNDDDRTPGSRPARGWAVSAWTVFVLAMLSKPSAVMVPLMLACIECWRGTRWRAAVRRLWPYAVAAIPIAAIADVVQPARLSAAASPVWARPLVAADALGFYLGRIARPAGLAIVYGRTPGAVLAGGAVRLAAAAAAVVVLALLVWRHRRRSPDVALGAGLFVVPLLPVLGLLPFDFQQWSTVADHYAYPAMFGIGLLAAVAARRAPRPAALAAVVLVAGVLTVLSARQIGTWRDSRALFTRAVTVTPDNPSLRKLLASQLLADGDYPGAIAHCRAGLAHDPTGAGLYDVLGSALRRAGDHPAAAAAFRAAIRNHPDYIPAHQDLAALLLEDGDPIGAAAEQEIARRLLAAEPSR